MRNPFRWLGSLLKRRPAKFEIVPGRPMWQLIAAYVVLATLGVTIWQAQLSFIVLVSWIGFVILFTIGLNFVAAFTYWLEEDSGRLNGKKHTPGWFWAFPGFTTFKVVVFEVQETEHSFEATTSDGGEVKKGKIIVRWLPDIMAKNKDEEDLFVSLGGKPSFDMTIIGFLRAFIQVLMGSLTVENVNAGRSILRDMLICQFKLDANHRPEHVDMEPWLRECGVSPELIKKLRTAENPLKSITAAFEIYGQPGVSSNITKLLEERGNTKSYLERKAGTIVEDIAELTFELSDQSVETLRTKQRIEATEKVAKLFKEMDKETQEATLVYEGKGDLHIIRTTPGAGNLNVADLNLGEKKGKKS